MVRFGSNFFLYFTKTFAEIKSNKENNRLSFKPILKRQINELSAKQNREKIMIKIKDEIQKANQKENYFTEEEKVLFSTFLKKIFKELDLAN